MENKKYIRFTYNGGAITELKYKDYLKNIDYWARVTAKQETFYKK